MREPLSVPTCRVIPVKEILDPGDRVGRRPLFQHEPMRMGTVEERYAPSGSYVYACPWWIYAVTWDDTGLTERGYLREGLMYFDYDTRSTQA